MNLAFAVAAALFERERTGRARVVDVSLLATALWTLAGEVLRRKASGLPPSRLPGIP